MSLRRWVVLLAFVLHREKMIVDIAGEVKSENGQNLKKFDGKHNTRLWARGYHPARS